jgi:predicted site-specific integrase-resolvase
MPTDTPAPPALLKPLLTSAEVQRLLRVHPRTQREYIARGQLSVVCVNARRLLFDREDVRYVLAAWKERHEA